jgi:hypothetical protein
LRWCADTIECNFRARRRLGMPLHACVEAKAADLERLAIGERNRAHRLASLPPSERNPEYEAVIHSDEWKAFMDDQKLMARSKCEGQSCGGSVCFELEGHHLTYERFGRERPEDVLVLCPVCHPELDAERRAGQRLDVKISVVGDPPRRVVKWGQAR